MLTGERVRLRAMKKEDLPHFVRWFNDPEVRQHLKIFQPMSLDQEEKWYADILTRPVEEQPLSIEIMDAGGWIFVGNCGFMQINQHDRSAEIGISIGDRAYWNKGYGTEAMQLLVDHGFMNLNLNRVYLHVYATNPRAVQSYEKAGFSMEGTLREARYLNGAYVDVIVMGILKGEWNNSKIGEG